MSIGNKLYTVGEFERVIADPVNQERLLELIEGEIIEKMPTEEHGIIAGWIITFLNIYLMQHPIGTASVEARYQLEDDQYNSLLPDVSLNLGDREPVKKGSVPQMPDLAVEIKSPDDTYKGLRAKADYYLRNGSQMVWLIFPEKEFVEVYRPGVDVDILKIEDMVDGGELLPGFQLPVQKIFRRK